MALTQPDADVTITLAVALKKRVWANKIHFRATKLTTRYAGKLETGANAHTGLVISLVAVIKRSMSNRQLGRNKAAGATIKIVTSDQQFAHACDLLASGLKVTGLRCSKQFYQPLARALKRFKIRIEVVSERGTAVESLRDWAVNALTPEIEDHVSMRVFTPKRVVESQSV